MCIGIPMQVLELEPGHALCAGRGGRRRVRTALVGEPRPGDWLLVFLDSAQERITAERAAEVDATLDLLAAVQAGEGGGADAAFTLPSQLSAHELLALTGAHHHTMETTT
ncbi:HypC/HybG/HupF family hydrogenase formation chaperone [Roseateles puraquae]|jgi:hydrogenase expression/formation protein HypC|uniref:HypC/HybG/HupF family hydrogenase formation chaperone n=1 Tax=Roseateles puraquae TaxID=431059 RepID=UPI001A637EB4|nr:HypC/HybG/HupF family hydrogenase formation chaperone [Roseateles sp.]